MDAFKIPVTAKTVVNIENQIIECGPPSVDADQGGFTSLNCGGIGCDDDDPVVNTAAEEHCNNMDDNCYDSIDEKLEQICYSRAGWNVRDRLMSIWYSDLC